MRARIAVVFAICLFLAVALLLWRFDQIQMAQSRVQANELQAQVLPLVKKSLQHKITELSQNALTLKNRLNGGMNYRKSQVADSQTTVLAVLTWSRHNDKSFLDRQDAGQDSSLMDGSSDEPNLANIVWSENNSASAEVQKEILQQLELFRPAFPSTLKFSSSLIALGTERPSRHLMLITNDYRQSQLIIFKALAFSESLIPIEKANFNVVVTNHLGQRVASGLPDYIGSSLKENSFVLGLLPAILDSSQPAGRLESTSDIAVYEILPNTNLALILESHLPGVRDRWLGPLLWLGALALGLGLMGLALMMGLVPELETVTNSNLSNSFGPSPSVGNESDQRILNTQNSAQPKSTKEPTDRLKAFAKLSSALGQEMKGPVQSLLTHLELISVRENANMEHLKPHLQALSQNVHEIKSVVDKISAFSGDDKYSYQSISLSQLLARVLKGYEAKFTVKGIRVHKNIGPVSEKLISPELMARAIESVLNNSIEAMDRMPNKEITISVRQESDVIELVIKDSGDGIAAKDLDQVFDPFFTTKPTLTHSGLGLTLALGVLRNHNGQIEVLSEKGIGTTVRMLITGYQANQLKDLRTLRQGPPPEPLISPLASSIEPPQLGPSVLKPVPTPLIANREIEQELRELEATLLAPIETPSSPPDFDSNIVVATPNRGTDHKMDERGTSAPLPTREMSRLTALKIHVRRPGLRRDDKGHSNEN